jgi:hypothetical protein
MDFSELSRPGQIDRALEVGHASPLRARLEDSLFTIHGIRELLARIDGNSARFFAVNILPRPSGKNRGSSVPSVSGSNQNRIDIFPSEQFTEVAI